MKFDPKETGIRSRLLVVDDNEMNRDLLSRRLQNYGYETDIAENGVQALERLADSEFDLVLLDVMMPDMNGYQVLEAMQADKGLNDIPVVMVSALDEVESAVRCIELGAEDYLHKPINAVLLKTKVAAILEKKYLRKREKEMHLEIENHNRYLEQRVQEQVRDISIAQMSAIFALSKLSESRDNETGAHLERVREFCKLLCRKLRDTPKYESIIDDQYIEYTGAASPLHDIGKVGIPDQILLKQGKLTDEEWLIMKTHPVIGAETLRAVDRNHPGNEFIRIGIAIAEGHHEKWDGSGYPYGLKGEQIPLEARIMALSDVYDALTSKRCYKEAFSHEKSREIILSSNNTHFDPDVINAFLAAESEFMEIRAAYIDVEE